MSGSPKDRAPVPFPVREFRGRRVVASAPPSLDAATRCAGRGRRGIPGTFRDPTAATAVGRYDSRDTLRLRTALALVAACALLNVPGCIDAQQQARREAAQRWDRVRAQVKAQLAAEHLDAGNIRGAAGELAEAVRLHPAEPGLAPLRARVWLAEGNIDEAATLLEQTHLEGKAQAVIEYLLGVVRQQQQRWEEALRAYARAAELDSEQVGYVVALAQAFLQVGRPEEALHALQAAAPRFGWTSEYLAALAECHEQLGDWAAAAQAWRAVAPSTGAGTDIRERLAEALYRAGPPAEAIPVLTQLLREEQSGAPDRWRLMLAECYLVQGRFELAREQLQAVLQHEPDHSPALLLLSCALAGEGQNAAALRIAQRALALRPDEPRALELTSALAVRAAESQLATALAARLRAIDPQNPVARSILERPGVPLPDAARE